MWGDAELRAMSIEERNRVLDSLPSVPDEPDYELQWEDRLEAGRPGWAC